MWSSFVGVEGLCKTDAQSVSNKARGCCGDAPRTEECERGHWASSHCSVAVIPHKVSSDVKGEITLLRSF